MGHSDSSDSDVQSPRIAGARKSAVQPCNRNRRAEFDVRILCAGIDDVAAVANNDQPRVVRPRIFSAP